MTPSIASIKQAVATSFGIELVEMTSGRRSRAVAWPRQVAMYLARDLTPKSLPNIGRQFGNRDHTTVLHAIRAVERRMKSDSLYQAEVAATREICELTLAASATLKPVELETPNNLSTGDFHKCKKSGLVAPPSAGA